LSAVPDRPAWYPTRAAPICLDAVGQPDQYQLFVVHQGFRRSFCWVLFRSHRTRTGRAASRASKTAQPCCQAVPDVRAPGGRSHEPHHVDASKPMVNQVLDSSRSSDLGMLVSGAIDTSDVRAIW